MSGNGDNGKIKVEDHFDLDSTMLMEAIFHYLAQREIKPHPGVEIEWNIDYIDVLGGKNKGVGCPSRSTPHIIRK